MNGGTVMSTLRIGSLVNLATLSGTLVFFGTCADLPCHAAQVQVAHSRAANNRIAASSTAGKLGRSDQRVSVTQCSTCA